MLTLLLVLVAVTTSWTATTTCPSRCKCYVDTVDCVNRSLSVLDVAMFNCTGASHVPELQLEHNTLTSLPGHVFDPLLNLKTLTLSYNYIEALEPDVLSKLTLLKFLYVRNNRLTSLPLGVFKSQRRLVVLDLRENFLETLAVQVLEPLVSLSTLGLSGNLFVCNCSLRDVVAWSTIYVESNDAECVSPPMYRGSLWSVTQHEMCSSSSTTYLDVTRAFDTSGTMASTSGATASTADTSGATASTSGATASTADTSGATASSANTSYPTTSTADTTSTAEPDTTTATVLISVAVLVVLASLLGLGLAAWCVLRRRQMMVSTTTEQNKGLEPLYDDVWGENHYEDIELGKEDKVRYVSSPS